MLRGFRPRWRLRLPRHIGFSCDVLELRAPCHARLLARIGAAAFGRSGHWQRGLRPRWRARWHLHWHAILSSLAVQARASACSQALDATCVSRKNYVVHGDASFCPERKIPTNIAGTLYARVSRANAQEAKSTVYGQTHKVDASRRAEKCRNLRVKVELR